MTIDLTIDECIENAERYLIAADSTSDHQSKLAYSAMARAYQHHAELLIQWRQHKERPSV